MAVPHILQRRIARGGPLGIYPDGSSSLSFFLVRHSGGRGGRRETGSREGKPVSEPGPSSTDPPTPNSRFVCHLPLPRLERQKRGSGRLATSRLRPSL